MDYLMPYHTNHRRARAGIDPKLLVALGVLAVVAIAVWVWSAMSGGKGSIGADQQTYYCVFDDGEAYLSLQELYEWQQKGNAIISRDIGGTPTRVRCPVCDRPSCIRPDPETGEEIEVDPDWNFESWDFNPSGRGVTP